MLAIEGALTLDVLAIEGTLTIGPLTIDVFARRCLVKRCVSEKVS